MSRLDNIFEYWMYTEFRCLQAADSRYIGTYTYNNKY